MATDTATAAKPAQKHHKKKKEKSVVVFIVGISILSCICIPYIYYTLNINAYGLINKPEGYRWPRYSELWKTVVGAIVLNVVRVAIHFVFGGLFYKYSKI